MKIKNSIQELRIQAKPYQTFENIIMGLVGFISLFIWLFYFKVGLYTTEGIISWLFIILGFTISCSILFWTFFGKEELVLHSKGIQLSRKVFGIGYVKNFTLFEIKEFSLVEQPFLDSNNSTKPVSVLFGSKNGRIRFYANQKMYTFGLSLTPAEAENVFEIINTRFYVGSKK